MTDPSAEWLTVPDLVDALGLSPGKIHRLIEERHLLAIRVDGALRVPASFVQDGEPLHDLRGTVTLLADNGFSDDEAVHWLTSIEESLGVAPVDALRSGRKTEVRRVAQALAF